MLLPVTVGFSKEGEEGNKGIIPTNDSQQQPSFRSTRKVKPEHFTFSNIDFWKNRLSNQRQQLLIKMTNGISRMSKKKNSTGTTRRKQGRSCLWCGFMVIFICQVMMFLFQMSISNYYHHSNHNLTNRHGEMGLALFLSKTNIRRGGVAAKSAPETNTANIGHVDTNKIRPRLLLGLFSDYGSDEKIEGSNSKVYRNRHRKLFGLWNDTRLCPYNAFRERQYEKRQAANKKRKNPSQYTDDEDDDDDECLILYTFVIGAHPRNSKGNISSGSSIPTMRLEATAEEPLELQRADKHGNFILPDDIEKNLPSDLKKNNDYTLLNIRENMNDGKSPSFFAWAHYEATISPKNLGQHPNSNRLFGYAAKCDLDAMLRLDFLLQVLHNDLMWIPNDTASSPKSPTTPPPLTASESSQTQVTRSLDKNVASVGGIVLGCLRHKAKWRNATNDDFWKANFQSGMHFYLGGQFYIISINLVAGLIQEARRIQQANRNSPANYMAGHEDHDVLSMVQVAAVKNGQLVRWISMPRNYRFWEHPVKGEQWWKRIWRREERKASEGKLPSRNKYVLPPSPGSLPSLLIVLGASSPQSRESYRKKLITEQVPKQICSLQEYNTTERSDSSCDLVYVFAVGANDMGPSEIVRNGEQLELHDSQTSEKDVLLFNIRDNVDQGMGQTALFYLQTLFNSTVETIFDMIVFCNAQTVLLVEQWNMVQYQHTRFHRNLLVGDIRDKAQLPQEFGKLGRNETYFFLEQEDIHLYPGSNDSCFAVSTNLIGNILHHANETFGLSKDNRIIRMDTSRKRTFKIYNPRSYFEENLGHDLSTLAYMTQFTALHWVPIPKGQAPWYHLST